MQDTQAKNTENIPEKQAKDKKPMTPRKKYALYAAVVTAVVILGCIVLNVVTALLETRLDWRVDTTADQLYSIGSQTRELLQGLDSDIYIYTLFTEAPEDQPETELLKRYAAESGRVHFENINPERDPAFTQGFDPTGQGIQTGSVIVTNADRSRYRVLSQVELYLLTYTEDYSSIKVVGTRAEQKLSSAVQYVATGQQSRLMLLSGQGETSPGSLSAMLTALDGLNYEMLSYDAAQSTEPLNPETDTLCVVSPTSDLDQTAYQALDEFLAAGGDAVFFMDHVILNTQLGVSQMYTDTFENFNALFMRYGIELNTDLVVCLDQSRYYERNTQLIPGVASHEITQGLQDGQKTLMVGECASLNLTGDAAELLNTEAGCYSKAVNQDLKALDRADGDAAGPFSLCAVSQNGDSRIAVYGTSSLISSETEFTRAGNRELVVNTFNYVSEREDTMIIPEKRFTVPTLQIASNTQRMILTISVIIVIPALILICGIVVHLRRRRL